MFTIVSEVRDDQTDCRSRFTTPVLFTIALTTISLVISSAQAQVASVTPTKQTEDATSQSSRERDRILLKRSPIASEYQRISLPGEFYSATRDAEGVDFRARFSLPRGKPQASSVQLEANTNYQQVAGEPVPGGSLKIAKSVGKLSVQLQIQRNASERTIDLYQARWLALSIPEVSTTDVLLLGFPRYSQDTFDTKSINTRWRADYPINDTIDVSYEGMATNYDDIATRNRLEFQNGVGNLTKSELGSDGSTISQATISESRIRRYFHQMETARDIQRHKISVLADNELGSTELGMYYSRWENQRLWLPWNFVDRNITSQYNVLDRYLPSASANNINIFDVSNSVFSNYRPTLTTTTDTDYALLLDWDRKLQLGHQDVWLGAGAVWRTKERKNQSERSVYTASANSFSLTEVVGSNSPESILGDQYLLPTGMDTAIGQDFFSANQTDLFTLNQSQSFLESIQDRYTSEETVNALYINAYQQREDWFWRVGLRVENTQTHTRGAVSGPTEANVTSQGDPINSIELNGQILRENFDSFDAAFVEGSNHYQHILPSVELRYQLTQSLSARLAYFEQLMRPQYFDTVRYRRVSPPTRTITEGSPDLAATAIQNSYAGMTYRYSKTGQLAGGLYYNKVKDFFYDSVGTELLDNILYDVTRVENGKSGFIKGIQAYWAHQLPLMVIDQASIKLAYTYSDTEANLGDRTITMPERARHRIGLHVKLSHQQWQYQTQFSWQSRAVDDVGPTAAQDTIREDFLVWNQSLTWFINQQWSTQLALNNVLDYPDRSYQGEPSRVVNNLYSGRTARLSLRFQY